MGSRSHQMGITLHRWFLAGLISFWATVWSGLWLVVDTAAEESVAGVSAVPVVDGNLRLDRSVVPTHYTLELTIDPSQETFSGQVAIVVNIAEETAVIRLHGQDMTFTEAVIATGEHKHAAQVVSGENGGLALVIDPPLASGQATIHLSYQAPFSPVPAGLYRVEDRGQWYAFTQFEPLDARKAFPSFDQPEFKTPYAVTLHVPKGMQALTNGPQREHREDEKWDVFSFAETKPLPTYLVAFAIGPFDLVSAEKSTNKKVPQRIIATKDKGKLAAFALKRTPPILQWLADYFAQPYPFAKLDQVAVPNFSAGAMENVGLVTYRERLLLLDEANAPIWDRMWSQVVIAHELAHMWYGNLVTMPWWDDLWLNEAFATWMSMKVVADIDPELEAPLEALSRTHWAMDLDAKKDARAIRQPIRHGGDIVNAFDAITYTKGAAVLRMIEAWLGAGAFRDGVRAYMREHAYGSGATADLLAALGKASGKPVAETMRLFLDQPGTPLVNVNLTCEAENTKPATLKLTQRRYRMAGSDVAEGQPWAVPVCVGYGFTDGDSRRQRECFLFDEAEKEVVLSQPGCPVWFHPNADEQGYYRWQLEPELLAPLVDQEREQLSIVERVALPGQLLALVKAGALPVTSYAEALKSMSQERHRKVIDQVASGLWYLHHTTIDDGMADAFAAYTRALLASHLERIGTQPKTDEAVGVRLLRPSLISALADMGKDTRLRSHARAIAKQFLQQPDSVSTETLGVFLPIAAWSGDETLWSQLVAMVPKASSPALRDILVQGLGSFEDLVLIKRSLDLTLNGTLRAQDYRTLAEAIRQAARPAAWEWLTENYDQVVKKLGQTGSVRLPWLASSFCSQDRAAQVKAFFNGREGVPEGTARNLSLALEDIEQCARQREVIREPLLEFLAGESQV